MQVPETCGRVLQCCHDGRVETLFHTIDIIDQWLSDAGTEPTLQTCLVEYAQGWGGVSMTEVCQGMGEIYISMANNQDRIEWWRFMEGMVCKKIRGIQEVYAMIKGMHTSAP
jgi:hypothetical protein